MCGGTVKTGSGLANDKPRSLLIIFISENISLLLGLFLSELQINLSLLRVIINRMTATSSIFGN
jgi:hypothetical protein